MNAFELQFNVVRTRENNTRVKQQLHTTRYYIVNCQQAEMLHSGQNVGTGHTSQTELQFFFIMELNLCVYLTKLVNYVLKNFD